MLWQLRKLTELPSYTMADHRDVLQAMVDKATEGVLSQAVIAVTERLSAERKAEMDEQKIGVRIAAALTPVEVAAPDTIRAREKLRIAADVGCDVAKVTLFLQGYDMSRTMHGWLAERKRRGLPLPASIEDYYALVQAERVGMGGDAQRRVAKDSLRRGGVRAALRKEVSGRMN